MDNAYSVKRLGPATIASPLGREAWVGEDERVVDDPSHSPTRALTPSASFDRGGPRAQIFFPPSTVRAGIVTCGGLCPGINNTIRALYLTLHHGYGVESVVGFRYGFEGMVPAGLPPLALEPEHVRHVHRLGGSFLGTSRGRQDVGAMVDTIERLGLHVLFTIGGNGTLAGADALHTELARRGRSVAVVGIPKTIDDDIPYLDKTFGFETAVDMARSAIDAAHTEATGARYGIGIVKLMGRDSGFIAATAALASAEANFCLLPEFPFSIEGRGGLLAAVEERLARRGHAVIVVAEGCGASLVHPGAERDASGNLRYASADLDIGVHVRDVLHHHFAKAGIATTIKYIDPSYTIRAAPANATDAVYCAELARHAAHAAMAGRTDVVVGRYHGHYVEVPIPLAISRLRRVDESLWNAVREVTGQPPLLSS